MRTSHRTFIAIPAAPELEQSAGLLINRLRASTARVKWVDPRQLHWTLKFLGEVELRETAAICKAVAEAVAPLAPFDIDAVGAGAFPDAHRPRTVWLGMGQGSEEMAQLHDVIDRALEPLGYRSENRRFRPHITLGRVRQSTPEEFADLSQHVLENADFEGGLSSVHEVFVFTSELTRTGPVHEPLAHAELLGD